MIVIVIPILLLALVSLVMVGWAHKSIRRRAWVVSATLVLALVAWIWIGLDRLSGIADADTTGNNQDDGFGLFGAVLVEALTVLIPVMSAYLIIHAHTRQIDVGRKAHADQLTVLADRHPIAHLPISCSSRCMSCDCAGSRG